MTPDAPTISTLETQSLLEEEKNPNKMEPEQYAMLVEAIRQVGFLQPILVRPLGVSLPNGQELSAKNAQLLGGLHAVQYRVVDGHHRLRAAKELGLAQVPCVIVEKDDEEAVALALGMNRLRGELDLAQTAQSLEVLVQKGWTLGDLTITGFSADEIADLLRSLRTDEVDVMAQAIEASDAEDEPDEKAKIFSIEIQFTDRAEFKRAKKGLKKAAGKSGDLAKGLLRLLGE